MAEHRRAETWWESLLEEAFLMEDIIENRNSAEQRIRSTFWVERHGSCGSIQDKFRKLKRIFNPNPETTNHNITPSYTLK